MKYFQVAVTIIVFFILLGFSKLGENSKTTDSRIYDLKTEYFTNPLGIDDAQPRSIIESMYGKIESAWEYKSEEFSLIVEIPSNTLALVTLPGAAGLKVTENSRNLPEIDGVLNSEILTVGNDLEFTLGSGRYTFTYSTENLPSVNESSEDFTYSSDMKIGEILANKKARSILQQPLTELSDSPWLSKVMGFTLKQASGSLPPSYQLNGSMVNKIQNDLIDLNK